MVFKVYRLEEKIAIGTMVMIRFQDFIWELAHKENHGNLASMTDVGGHPSLQGVYQGFCLNTNQLISIQI